MHTDHSKVSLIRQPGPLHRRQLFTSSLHEQGQKLQSDCVMCGDRSKRCLCWIDPRRSDPVSPSSPVISGADQMGEMSQGSEQNEDQNTITAPYIQTTTPFETTHKTSDDNVGASQSHATSPMHLEDMEHLERGFVQLNGHDVSDKDSHIQIETFAQQLHDGINALMPTRGHIRYTEVLVLLLRWDDDNLGVCSEVHRLGDVFFNHYRFKVSYFNIPSESPARKTIARVSALIEESGKDTLIIMYYAGHAARDRDCNGPAIWSATDKPESAKFSSFGVQQILEEAKQDVLLLYDCCYASHPGVNTAGRGVTEVIAACGFETQAPAVGPHSFTNALIHELEELFHGPPVCVAELHGRILGSLKSSWRPDFLRDPMGNIWKDENGKPRRECEKRRTPIHCLLTTEGPRRTVMLGPLQPNLSQEAVEELNSVRLEHAKHVREDIPPKLAASTSSPSLGYRVPINASPTPPASRTTPSSGSPKLPQYPEVIIRVSLEEDYFTDSGCRDDDKKHKTWLEWLRNIPDAAQRVTIHGIYRSFSTLMIISMPLALWNILPRHPSSAFIGYIMSGNLAEPLEQARGLPSMVSIPGKVNLKNTNVKQFEDGIPPANHGLGGGFPNSRDAATQGGPKNEEVIGNSRLENPIKFTDFCGRKFKFSFQMCNTWKKMENLITNSAAQSSYRGEDEQACVEEGRYDLTDLTENVLLPQTWDHTIRPGMHITMRLWALPRSRYLSQDHTSAYYGSHAYPGNLGTYYPHFPSIPPPIEPPYALSAGLRPSPSMESMQPMNFHADRRRSYQTIRPHHSARNPFASQKQGERRSKFQSRYDSETDGESELSTLPLKRKPVSGTVVGGKAAKKQEEAASSARTAANMSMSRERPKEQVVGLGYDTPPEM